MTRTHTARIEVQRWKAHVCLGCGCRYAYLMRRRAAHGGATPERATEKAQAAADRTVTREVDRQPCPACGLYQPDMLAGPRQSGHRWLLLGVGVLGILAGLHFGDLLRPDQTLMLAMAVVGVVAALGCLLDGRDPNHDLAANRLVAERAIASGGMKVLEPGGTPPPNFEPPSTWRFGMSACALAAAAILLLAAPEVLRRGAAWPLNSDWHPPVVGPGDSTYLYLPESIASINGFWSGTSRVTVRRADAPEAGEIEVESQTRQFDWGKSIHAKKNERAMRRPLWVRVRLPAGDEYAGKELVFDIALIVRYPTVHNDEVFMPQVEGFRHEATAMLAVPGAADRYRWWCWTGFLGGAALHVASVVVRMLGAAALRRAANPAVLIDEPPAA